MPNPLTDLPATAADLLSHRRAGDDVAVGLSLDRRGAPVSRLLFSQFLEHMSYATLGGLSAELVVNPTFHPEHHLRPDQVAQLRANADAATRWAFGDRTAIRDRWVSSPLASGWSVTVFDDETPRGIPLGWAGIGRPGAVRRAVGRIGGAVRIDRPAGGEGPAPNGDPARRTIPLDGPVAGVRQAVYVPVHRTNVVHVRLWARAESGTSDVEIGIRRRLTLRGDRPAGEVLARAVVRVGTGDWGPADVLLEVADGAVADHEPTDLYVVNAGGIGAVHLDRISALPVDHVHGFDPEVLEIARRGRIGELRWPGGNFVSHYHWRDGVGPLDRRPTRANAAWGGLETNLIGTDEYLRLCTLLGATPHITVNTGTGTPEEAAAWVEYCNGPADSPMGRLRAQNGHTDPYDVTVWEVGNENFGSWQGGFTGSEENARQFAAFVTAMRAASPIPLRLHACGNWSDLVPPSDAHDDVACDGRWHSELLRQAPDDIDVISLHPLPLSDRGLEGLSESDAHAAVMAQVATAERETLPRLLAECDAARPEPPIRLSITEWGPIGEHRGRINVENVGGAVWGATMLATAIRLGERIESASANGFHHGGAIKKGAGVVYTDPVVDVVVRLRELAGWTPVHVDARGPAHDVAVPTDLGLPERDVPDVDVLALLAPDETRLVVLLVNRRLQGARTVVLDRPAGWAGAQVRAESLVGPQVSDRSSPVDPHPFPWTPTAVGTGEVLEVTVAPVAITLVHLDRTA